jgi:uncharacterized protein (DUF488 family)
VAAVPAPPATTVLTVGHSTHALEEFLALLAAGGVELIADVRRFPGSRRLPHFGSEALAAALGRAGVDYEHLPALGGRRRPVPGSLNGGWENAAFRGYADHMATPEFGAGLARLEELARERRAAIMCAEAPWWRCHRRLVSDALVVRGWEVRHLMPGRPPSPHELTPFALVGPGRALTYPPAQGELVPAR